MTLQHIYIYIYGGRISLSLAKNMDFCIHMYAYTHTFICGQRTLEGRERERERERDRQTEERDEREERRDRER